MSREQIILSIKSLIDIGSFFEDWENVQFLTEQLTNEEVYDYEADKI